MPMKAGIPLHRRSSNTSAPTEALTEEEKIAGLGGMIPMFPSETVAMRKCLTGTTKVKSQPPINKGRRNNLGSIGSRTSNKSSTT